LKCVRDIDLLRKLYFRALTLNTASRLRCPRNTRQPRRPVGHCNIARSPSDLYIRSIIMKASMMLTHTEARSLPSLRPSLIPKPPAPTPRGIPRNAQIREVASPTWKTLFLVILYIDIRISIREWSVGNSRWFSHGQSDQWLADRRQVWMAGRRRGRGWSLSQVRIALRAFAVAIGVEGRSKAVRWQAGGYSIQVAATRPRALKYSRWPYQSKTRNWMSDAHLGTTKQTTRRRRVVL